MKTKKAAIGLSVNILVVVIIGLVILGMGIGLLYQFIGGAQEIKGTLDQQTELQLESLINQGRTVALSTNTVTIRRGEQRVIGLGILNIEDRQTLYVEIPQGKFIDSEGTTQENVNTESWFLYNNAGFNLNLDESVKEPISIIVPKDAVLGRYIFSVKVCRTQPCTFESQYGNTQNFNVILS